MKKHFFVNIRFKTSTMQNILHRLCCLTQMIFNGFNCYFSSVITCLIIAEYFTLTVSM